MTREQFRWILVACCFGCSISSVWGQPSVPIDPDKVGGVPAFRTLKGFKELVTDVAFSPDSKMVAAVSYDGSAKLWSLEKGKPARSFSSPKTRFYNVKFSPDGKTLATTDNHKAVKLWDVATQKMLRELKGHTRNVKSLAFAPDGKTLTTGGQDRAIKFWDPETGVCRATLRRPGGGIPSVRYLPDGKTLVAAGFDDEKTISLVDLATGLTKAELPHPESQRIRHLAVSPDGKILAVATRVTTEALDAAKAAGQPIPNDEWTFLTFWNLETAKAIRTVPAITDGHTSINPSKSVSTSRPWRFCPMGRPWRPPASIGFIYGTSSTERKSNRSSHTPNWSTWFVGNACSY